ncbi:hypothetical protein EYF80_003382 [Liparis tanakae]|uniref:Uncharacterized protein n=1 Tax=Liparis tanakae TaxID=230148 RepID=A0A4Z2J8F3_9TELE|nr:hypothetical protein EYF80_003382 [Liparis tanakae]
MASLLSESGSSPLQSGSNRERLLGLLLGGGGGRSHDLRLHDLVLTSSSALPHKAASPVAHVAGAVFVGGTSRASTNPVHVLVAFGRVLGEIDPGAKHAADVGVALVEALVDDGVDEGGTWREKGHIPIKSIARRKDAACSDWGDVCTSCLELPASPLGAWKTTPTPLCLFSSQTIQPSLPTPPSAYWLAAPSPFGLHRGSYESEEGKRGEERRSKGRDEEGSGPCSNFILCDRKQRELMSMSTVPWLEQWNVSSLTVDGSVSRYSGTGVLGASSQRQH